VVDLEGAAVADIAAGGWHSMALTADGQIYVWGRCLRARWRAVARRVLLRRA
jgi:alpha-tubulin suppressor-like RCC1 family protein